MKKLAFVLLYMSLSIASAARVDESLKPGINGVGSWQERGISPIGYIDLPDEATGEIAVNRPAQLSLLPRTYLHAFLTDAIAIPNR